VIVAIESHQGAIDMQVTTIGLDIAKNVFQVHGIDAAEKVVVRKQLRRSQVLEFFKALPPCLVGMEACATAHYWARELTKLGHRVRLMPAKNVKAYVKRNKNDAADAEAICEAVRRPTMLIVLAAELQAMRTLIASIEKRIIAQHRSDEASKRLRSIPGIGLVGATAIVATITDPKAFRSGRDMAAWIGLVPRQDSTGGKQKLGPISKQGDRYLRRILVVGAHAVLKLARQKPEKYPWLTQLLARKPFKVVAVALANKMARIAWALLVKGGPYRARALVAAA
jgi:transposase